MTREVVNEEIIEEMKKNPDMLLENEYDVKRELIKNRVKERFDWLLEDISLSNLTGNDKNFVTNGLEVFMQTKMLENMEEESKNESFSQVLLHDIFARATVSGAVNMKKFDKLTTERRKAQYDIREQERRKKLLGIV